MVDVVRELLDEDGFDSASTATHVHLVLRQCVNEGLITIFFFVVGLEIKRELVDGTSGEPSRGLLADRGSRRRDGGACVDLSQHCRADRAAGLGDRCRH